MKQTIVGQIAKFEPKDRCADGMLSPGLYLVIADNTHGVVFDVGSSHFHEVGVPRRSVLKVDDQLAVADSVPHRVVNWRRRWPQFGLKTTRDWM